MPMSLAILIYGPDEDTNEEIARQLRNDGFAVNTATREGEALRKLHNDIPGLIIVDVFNAEERPERRHFCRNVRAVSEVPLALIADPEDDDNQELVAELSEKTTHIVELPSRRVVSRVEDILGHTVTPSLPSRMSLHISEGLWLDFATRQVRVKGEAIDLTPKEFELLSCLARNAGRLFTSEELIDLVWGGKKSDRAALKAYIWRLRQKIEDTPKRPEYILTRRGVGYFFRKAAS
jgi:two-component system response regulator VicR